jgi:hypothetical protein
VRESRPSYIRSWEWLLAVIPVIATGLASVASDLAAGKLSDWLQGAGWIFAVLWLAWLSVVLHRWVRRRHPELKPPEPPEPEPQPPAGTVTGLPPFPTFVGRMDDVSVVEAFVSATDRNPVVAVTGRRGVGTSACVKEVARRAHASFPGGVMYLNLRAGTRRLSARDATGALARCFGCKPPGSDATSAIEACVRELGGAMDNRHNGRVLLVLDNVDRPDQVRELLQLGGHCQLLLAGSVDLSDLGATTHELGLPGSDDAVEMLRMTRGRRPDLPPLPDGVADELVQLCGHQPRAVRALGYRLGRNRWEPHDLRNSIRQVVGTLPHQRVNFLEALELLAEQDVAYRALSPSARRLVRRFSLVPGPLGLDTIAALVGPVSLADLRRPRLVAGRARRRAANRATDLLNEVATARFVHAVPPPSPPPSWPEPPVATEPGGQATEDYPAQYELEPLLRAYARLHLYREESTTRRIRVQRRLMRHLARHARRRARVPAGFRGDTSRLPAGVDDPSRWFEQHQALLHALVTGLAVEPGTAGRTTGWSHRRPGRPRLGWGRQRSVQPRLLPRRLQRWWFRLARALCVWYAAIDEQDEEQDEKQEKCQAWEKVCRAVLETPTGRHRRRLRSWAFNEIGAIQCRRGQHAAAIEALSRSLVERGHWGQAQVLTNLGRAELVQARDKDEDPKIRREARQAAVDRLEEARRHRSRRDRGGRARTELALGVANLDEGRSTLARVHLSAASDLFEQIGDDWGYAVALTNLGLAEELDSEGPDGRDTARRAVTCFDEVRQRLPAVLDDPAARATALLNCGAMLCGPPPEPGEARKMLERARELWPDRGYEMQKGRTLLYLGRSLLLLAHDDGGAYLQEAKGLCDRAGDSGGLEEVRRALAELGSSSSRPA